MEKDMYKRELERFMNGTQDTVKLCRNTPDGDMTVSACYILPGIFLALNDIHMQTVPCNREGLPLDLLIMNYCLQGRCEFKLDDDSYNYIDYNMMNITAGMAQDYFYYPASAYLGYEIYIFPDMFQKETENILELFHISIRELQRLYKKGVACYASDELLRLWNDISSQEEFENVGQLRLDVLQILKHMQEHPMIQPVNTLYLSKAQTMLAKQAQELLVEDLSRHLSMKAVSERLRVSETSLKRYFRFVYGMNVSAYMNERRMVYAAELLTESKQSIADIARACGYVNQGRFAQVFRDYYGERPLDYRRMYSG